MTRKEIIEAISVMGRQNSTRTVLFHAAIAERLGLNASDHKCADLLMAEPGPVTPGRLAELTGLTAGAITGVLDRLEKANFIAREHDREDRRRILVRLTPERMPDVGALFAPLAAGMRELCSQYSAEQLALILDFSRGANRVLMEAAETLRRLPVPADGDDGAKNAPAPRAKRATK